jgi:hypothetical protein
MSALQITLSNKESELATLDLDNTSEAATVIRRRHVLRDEIQALKDEEKLLEVRLARENDSETAKVHRARVNRVRLILDARAAAFKDLDAAIEKLGRAAMAIHRIDTQELLPEISGIDSGFAVNRADWQILALIRLASLGLGQDKRIDRHAPAPALLELIKDHHACLLEEVTNRPATLAADKARQAAEWERIRAENPSANY